MAGKVAKLQNDQKNPPGGAPLAAPEHTSGHSAFLVPSSGEELTAMPDSANRPAPLAPILDRNHSFGMIPDPAIATRKRFPNLTAEEGVQVAFCRAPFPATGFIERAQNGFRFIPVVAA